MGDVLLAVLLWTTDNLRPWTGLLSFAGGLLGLAGAIWGILSKRASTAAKASSEQAKATSDETNVLVQRLVTLLEASADREAALAKKVTVDTDKIRTIAGQAITPKVLAAYELFAELEADYHRRQIAELEGVAA